MSRYGLAKAIFSRWFPDEVFVSQPAESWLGDFPLPTAVADYYADLGASDVQIEAYGNPISLPSLARLWAYQIGYRFHGLTGERIEDWDDDWLVVAGAGADPFIFSRGTGGILHAFHGEGEWQPTELFADLPAMATTFAVLGEIVRSAGDDFTDDDCLIRERLVVAAKAELSRILNSEAQAETVLDALGWTG